MVIGSLFGPWALCIPRQNQEVGFWWLSWVKVVCLGDVLSLWMSTGMTREEFTDSFYPLSTVASLACAYCWTLCELLALAKCGFDSWPSSLRTEGCHVGQAEMEQAGRMVQLRILLSSVSGAVCFGKRSICRIKWKAAAVHCLQGGSHKRVLQAFGTGAGFLLSARFCYCWALS